MPYYLGRRSKGDWTPLQSCAAVTRTTRGQLYTAVSGPFANNVSRPGATTTDAHGHGAGQPLRPARG